MLLVYLLSIVQLHMHYRDFYLIFDQSNVFRDLTILESLLKGCIPLPKKIYKRTKRLRTIEEV